MRGAGPQGIVGIGIEVLGGSDLGCSGVYMHQASPDKELSMKEQSKPSSRENTGSTRCP